MSRGQKRPLLVLLGSSESVVLLVLNYFLYVVFTAYDDEVEGTSAIRSSQGVDPNQDSVERQQKHGASVKQSEIERIDADFEMNKPKTTDMQLYIDYEKMKNEMKLLQARK